METTKYGIIWSQNVHFVTTLLVPANKKLSENVHFVTNLTVTGTGGLYPRVRDFSILSGQLNLWAITKSFKICSKILATRIQDSRSC